MACALALVVAFSGCASRPASAIANGSTVLSATAASVARPTSVAQSGGSLGATATVERGTPTAGPGSVVTPAEAQPTETPATSAQNPATTPSAVASPGTTPNDTAAVPLFLTITAPADELLEVPAGTAQV